MASFSNYKKIILTFPNSLKKTKQLISIDRKLSLLQKLNFDYVLPLDLSKEMLSLSYFDFLKILKDHFNFQYLILGKNALFGFNHEGSEQAVKKLQKELHFKAIYLAEKKKYQKIISTTRIKDYLLLKDFKRASALLGRPYAIYLKDYQLQDGRLKGCAEDVYLPPSGHYLFQMGQEPFLTKESPIVQGTIRKAEILLKIKSASSFKKFINLDQIILFPLNETEDPRRL